MTAYHPRHSPTRGGWPGELLSELGPEVVSTDRRSRAEHAVDAWPLAVKRARVQAPVLPEAVAFPRSTGQVALLVAWAGRRSVTVVPWGAGSSVTGAPLPTAGGLVVDLRALDEVLELDEQSLTVTVQAGMMGGALEEWLGRRGFTTHFSPQSLHRSTVGGWVATRATGQLSTRWGGIEDLVIALTVVLPDGEVVRLSDHPRSAHGPDLMHLFTGAEGTLGVVTEVTLRVFPAEPLRELDAFVLPDVPKGVEAMRGLLRDGLRPALLRFYDEDESRHLGDDRLSGGCALLIGFAGPAALAEVEHRLARTAIERLGGVQVGSEPTEAWLDRRYDFSRIESLLQEPGGYAETIEVAHGWSGILVAYQAFKRRLGPLADEVLGHFSHGYTHGTSLYLILLGRAADDEQAVQRLEAIWAEAMDVALEHGAAISHHHGIGLARSAYLPRQLGSAWPLLERIKRALDPAGVMNPGKLGFGDGR
jgi:alkyldihydroxyacetonephosphate synthase